MDQKATAIIRNGKEERNVTCLDCHYRVSSKDANGIVWNTCGHPDHRGCGLPYPRCDDFVEREAD